MNCKLFNCDKKHGNQCCSYCKDKEKCRNPCQNTPTKCGQLKEQEKEKSHQVAATTDGN